MKKILSLVITIALLLTSASVVYAKSEHAGKNSSQQIKQQGKQKSESKEQVFKINESPVIKYGQYKLPVRPVTKGMGSTVSFNQDTAVLTVVKGTDTIIIDFIKKTVTVNGAADTDSGIFNARNSNKMTVLIKYIAETFGIRSSVDQDKVTIEVPVLHSPTNVTVTPVGTTVKPNTLNSTTIYLTAAATITAGRATGGKAELYAGTRLIATDNLISATDTAVTFTTSDGTPTNSELQALVPAGGVVMVKLYTADGKNVINVTGNPTLLVDYVVPTITGITSAIYNVAGNLLYINVSGASAIGDAIDVTKISLYDSSLGRIYSLTNNLGTGSKGVVSNANTILLNIGSYDKVTGLTGFEGSDVSLMVAAGSLLTDAAGNALTISSAILNIPVSLINNNETIGLSAPTNITVIPSGGNVKLNTLNSTTLYLTAAAKIVAGQAIGGRAELFIGSKLIATDSFIGTTDTTVDFTTSDGTPVNVELQALVPAGGVVTVKFYNAAGNHITSIIGNPILTVDYTAPTITGVTSAVYLPADNHLYITVLGAASAGDVVDIPKISLYDGSLARTYVLTNSPGTGSNGTVINTNLLIINIGSADKTGLTEFEGIDVYLHVAAGSLLTDAAGNVSTASAATQIIPVTVIK